VRKADGEPYRVFTPFQRAWLARGWRAPADSGADSLDWFYADVLWHRPHTGRQNADRRFDVLPWDDGAESDRLFTAWCAGRTGYPVVDAGLRQLLAEGWMHNRVRMIVAGRAVHQPWRLPGGPPAGYPSPIVDHAVERVEALARYELVKASG